MAELVSEIIALLPLELVAPLATLLVLALVFRAVFPMLQSAAHDDRMPWPRVVEYAYSTFVVGMAIVILLLLGLILYRLFQ